MKTAIVVALSVLATGCGAAPIAAAVCETPATIELALESGPLLNPDAEGRPLPTEVRVYRLRDAGAFETLAFDAVWQSDSEALGDALVGVDSFTLYPGESTLGSVVPGAEARALVAMAIVRQPAGYTWRTVVELTDLPCGATSHVRLRVDEYRIERAASASGQE